ncbi:MAG: amidohydrolase family protein [Pseudomonadota bacterium]
MVRPFDGHVHVGAWRLPDFAGHASDPSDLLWIYRRWAYAGALVFSTDAADNHGLLEAIPRQVGELSFRHAFWVAPDLPDNLSTLEETADRWAALKIHPSLLRRPLGDAAFEPYLDVAASLHIPVLVHCGRWQEMAGHGLVLDVAARRPEQRFILGHMGGDSPHLVARCVLRIADEELGNVSLGTESIREPWVLERALERLGPTRLIFGSDYNLNHPEPFRRLIEVLDIPDAAREDIFIGNLDRLLPPAHRILGERVPHGGRT